MDFNALTYEQLTRKHPEYEAWCAKWDDYRLMYQGGEEFLRAAGTQVSTGLRSTSGTPGPDIFAGLPGNRRPRRFLWQLEGEPDNAYTARLERAFYLGYIGPIIDYFRHYLFSHKPEIRPETAEGGETPDAPEWFKAFDANCTGTGVSFMDFLKAVSLDVLVCRQAGWLIEKCDDAEGPEVLGGVRLQPFNASEIYDWQTDAAGGLEWVVLSRRERRREFPDERVEIEKIHYLDRQSHATWEVIHDGDKKELRLLEAIDHELGEVPFIPLSVPHGLWPANKLASWQLDMFNQSQVLARGQLLSCFIQPALTSNDPTAQSRVFGDGVLLHLRNNSPDGGNAEKFEWVSADIGSLQFVSDALKEKRDEGYRIVHQMSLAVDSQAVGAVARSGASKVEDRRSTEVILAGYGSYVRAAIVQTLNLMSKVFGDGLKWSCQGFDSFQVSSLDEELQIAALAQAMGIPSPTFEKRMHSKVAKRLMDHADEATIQQVEKEIDEAIEQKQEGASAHFMGEAQESDGNNGIPDDGDSSPIPKPDASSTKASG